MTRVGSQRHRKKGEGLSKHIWFLVYSSEFLDRNYKYDITRQCYIGGVPLCFYPASKWVSRQLSGACVAARSSQFCCRGEGRPALVS